VMAQLVSRFIWIWPTWDIEQASRGRPHESASVELGWFWVDKSIEAIDFCRCEHLLGVNGAGLRRCVYINATTDEETTMPSELCHVKTDYISEYVSADHAVNKMTSSRRWLAAGDAGGVIIDIDEDFFGCESPADQLAGQTCAWVGSIKFSQSFSFDFCSDLSSNNY